MRCHRFTICFSQCFGIYVLVENSLVNWFWKWKFSVCHAILCPFSSWDTFHVSACLVLFHIVPDCESKQSSVVNIKFNVRRFDENCLISQVRIIHLNQVDEKYPSKSTKWIVKNNEHFRFFDKIPLWIVICIRFYSNYRCLCRKNYLD